MLLCTMSELCNVVFDSLFKELFFFILLSVIGEVSMKIFQSLMLFSKEEMKEARKRQIPKRVVRNNTSLPTWCIFHGQ